jgi:PRELI-like family
VSLAFFLRYPNPYASHVLSCDVISRDFTPSGSLVTTRLILKTATLPRWAPRGIISRSESWILEESEVDPQGKIVRCLTRNLDHVKAMQVHETQIFSQVGEGCVDGFSISHMPIPMHLFQRKTLQTTEARIVSGFGWGLTRQIENYGLARFRKNVQRVRLFRRVDLRLSSLPCSRAKVSLSSLTPSVRLANSP